MSTAQIPTGTIVPAVQDKPIIIDSRTVIPVGAILKENTIVTAPLEGTVDTRDTNNKKGLQFVPPNSIIPDGVYLPKGTFIPQAVPVGSILPSRAIIPQFSVIPEKTSVPYGSIVVSGTKILEKDIFGLLDQGRDLFYKLTGSRGLIKHVPLGTVVPEGAAFPANSIIPEFTNLQGDNVSVTIPLGTRIYNADFLERNMPSLGPEELRESMKAVLKSVRENNGARLPDQPIVTNAVDPSRLQFLVLPAGVVVPKFSDGKFAKLQGKVTIPLLQDGNPSEIPDGFVSETPTDKEENKIARGTVVPKGCLVPPGTVIPPGAYIPPDTILFLSKRDDNAPIVVPPLSHIPEGTSLSKSFGGTNLNIPEGTYIPESSAPKIKIVPGLIVPKNFKLNPSGIVQNIRIPMGTYIPKTDLPLNIPDGTIIPADVPWTVQVRESYLQSLKETLVSAETLGLYFAVIHLFLTVYAVSVAFQETANVLGIAAALIAPEIYLLVMYYRTPRVVASDARVVNLLIFILIVILLWSARLN